jgi:restriction endonuclease S subunit
MSSRDIRNNVFIPKYYDPELKEQLLRLADTHDLFVLGELIDNMTISVQTGHEIGKMAYGTGNIPFVRTSDITNWEIKTIPKQGVSEEIYQQYAEKEDVQPGDILLVRDGTYLIGTNCFVTDMDIPMVYQSHILKFRVNDQRTINPYLLFLAFNNPLVQRQIRNMQFTADIIDTIGNRFREIIIPIPKDTEKRSKLTEAIKASLELRVKYKAAVKQMPLLIEQVLDSNSPEAFDLFFAQTVKEILSELVQDTTTLEFGGFSAFKMKSSQIANNIFLPKYYDPSISSTLSKLNANCELKPIQELIDDGIIALSTGDEIGKMAYGTGEIPFVRTSDFSNWEIKADTKQGVSEEIYQQYAQKEDVRAQDILIVRDGTYLVGTSCMITESDEKMLYCGGLIKIRVLDTTALDPFLLLGLINAYIVKRQIRTKQFTRDVIDTMGQRFKEVIIPIPIDSYVNQEIARRVKAIIDNRIDARDAITELARQIAF